MALADHSIMRLIGSRQVEIFPFNEENLKPVSVDLTLDNVFIVQSRKPGVYYRIQHSYIVLRPGKFVLAATAEHITISRSVTGYIMGKSSVARQGIVVESAGLVDPGWTGKLTLEVFNQGRHPVVLEAGRKIAQIQFHAGDSNSIPRRDYTVQRGGNSYGQSKSVHLLSSSEVWDPLPGGKVKILHNDSWSVEGTNRLKTRIKSVYGDGGMQQ